MNKTKTIFIASTLEVLLVLCVGCANLLLKPIYYFCFYNVLYGILFSFLIPLFILQKEENVFDFIGIKKLGKRQNIVLAVFVIFSIGGQLIPIVVKDRIIPWNLLPLGIMPLIMTTFFEEFLFRGFFQNKFEKEFGTITAIMVSGLMFSLYHVGYPKFRTFEDILLLLAVGIGFATAYKLSGNNLIVAYFVNLPNAFVTYMLKFEQFPRMTISSTIASIGTLCIIVVVFIVLVRANRKDQRKQYGLQKTHISFLYDNLIKAYGNEQGKRLYVLMCKKFANLCEKEMKSENHKINEHLFERLLPTISMYLTLIENDFTQEEALIIAHKEIQYHARNMSEENAKLTKIPFTYDLFKMFAKSHMKKKYPIEGFSVEWKRHDSKEIHFDIVRCLYRDMCEKYCCPELCTVFCQSDITAFSGYEPKIRFKRAGTLGEGADCCDFHFIHGNH